MSRFISSLLVIACSLFAATPTFTSINLDNYSENRPLRDEIAEDKEGGWTDQGNNDLRTLENTRIVSADVPFQVGTRGIILKSKYRAYFSVSSPELSLGGMTAERLAFCHATAWSEKSGTIVANYIVTYENGSSETIPVRYGSDVTDWWGGAGSDTTRIAWRGMNGATSVALFHSQWHNPHPEQPLKSLQVVSAETEAIPILVAVTLIQADAEGAAELDRAYNEKASNQLDTSSWFACPLDWRGNIQPGSALDISFLNHKPAGKYGFVRVTPQGQFEFEQKPGEELRFWGTNVAYAGCFPPKELAPGIARNLAMQGCNMVRLHLWGMQQQLLEDQLIFRNGSVNEDVQDRMEFFISELKNNGIYIYMDWNDGLMYDRLNPEIPPVEDYYSAEQLGVPWKFYCFFDDACDKAVRRLADLIFKHKNPYTGLSMTEDPAFAVFEITNENSVFSVPNGKPFPFGQIFPKDSAQYQKLDGLWKKWQQDHGIEPVGELSNLSTRDMPRLEMEFFAELESSYYTTMREYLHQLGVKVPVCGTNWVVCAPNAWTSRVNDLTGTHSYALGQRNGPLPGPGGACLTECGEESFPFFPALVCGRLQGKPMIVSEWQFEYPITTRCEGMPIMTAIASLNNWEGVICYCATGSNNWGRWQTFVENPNITTHTQHLDPATWGQAPLAAIAYRTRAIQPARHQLLFTQDKREIYSSAIRAEDYPFLCSMTAVATTFVDSPAEKQWPLDKVDTPTKVLAQAKKILEIPELDNCLPSDTGEIRRCFKPGLFIVDTPRFQAAVGALSTLEATGPRSLTDIKISSSARFASMLAVSLDNKELRESNRMLVSLTGDARNKTSVFKGDIHEVWGDAPVITEPVKITLTLPGAYQVYALNPASGQRLRELPVTDGTCTIDTGTCNSPYFEIVR